MVSEGQRTRFDELQADFVRAIVDGSWDSMNKTGDAVRTYVRTLEAERKAAPGAAGEALTDDGIPHEIWLQVYGDSSPDDGPPPDVTDGDVTWCWHRIFDHDVRYVRAAPAQEKPHG